MCEDEEDRPLDAVAALMARLAAGDMAAMTTLQERWGSRIKATLRRIALNRNVRLQADELDDLLVDAVLVLHDVAGSWSAEGGALPWVWAQHRLANVVDSYLGQLGPSIDDVTELHLTAAPTPVDGRDEADVVDVLARLAREGSVAGNGYRQVQHLRVALDAVASDRDRRIFLEVELQDALGDPSPANTVGGLFDLTPATVRQVRCRVRRKLSRYAAEVPEQGLTDLALVA